VSDGGGQDHVSADGGTPDQRLAIYARDVVEQFAAALDRDDFGRVRALLSPRCVYAIRDERLEGPDAICGSYAEAAAWGRSKLDELVYESEVVDPRVGAGHGAATVRFTDRMRHAGSAHVHTCEQRVELGADGLIASIEHVDLAGEREKASAWFEQVGLER
jgi:hypothetical protein